MHGGRGDGGQFTEKLAIFGVSEVIEHHQRRVELWSRDAESEQKSFRLYDKSRVGQRSAAATLPTGQILLYSGNPFPQLWDPAEDYFRRGPGIQRFAENPASPATLVHCDDTTFLLFASGRTFVWNHRSTFTMDLANAGFHCRRGRRLAATAHNGHIFLATEFGPRFNILSAARGAWETGPSIPANIIPQGMVSLGGRLFVGSADQAAWHDPREGRWSLTNPFVVRRQRLAGLAALNGELVAVGGDGPRSAAWSRWKSGWGPGG